MVARVEHNHFFVTLPAELVRVICKHMTFERYKPGDVVFRQGEVGESFYIVSAGAVAVTITRPSGLGYTACELHTGGQFCARSVLFALGALLRAH